MTTKTTQTSDGKRGLMHRSIAADRIGRPLSPDEIVHHRNRDHEDNRPANLVVLPSNSDHLRLHAAEKKVGHELDPKLFGGFRVEDDGEILIVLTPCAPEGLLRPEVIADILHCRPKTLQQWRYKGRGPKFIRIGGRYYYKQTDLDAYLNSGD